MSGFVFNPTAEATPTGPEPIVTNDGWFPDIDPAAVRKAISVREGVLPDRLREAIVSAILSAGNDLATWAAAQQLLGHADLAAVPARVVGGESRLLALYRRAVCAFVKAELAERYRDNDLTAAGQRDVSELTVAVDELRRDARHAIRDMLGRTRTTVELL
ncbi:MAG: head completion/stabilization protein [Sphingomonas bacterium]|jgi:hypothetical protein|nr:head completion/stabilization protein [Sphingomonas bacterium]MDB5688553.1 head completion/stabilization protein [Sphingomonas bacterium]